jgi:hypothetical protein
MIVSVSGRLVVEALRLRWQVPASLLWRSAAPGRSRRWGCVTPQSASILDRVPDLPAEDGGQVLATGKGIDPEEIITAVRTRRAPMMSASAGLKL